MTEMSIAQRRRRINDLHLRLLYVIFQNLYNNAKPIIQNRSRPNKLGINGFLFQKIFIENVKIKHLNSIQF